LIVRIHWSWICADVLTFNYVYFENKPQMKTININESYYRKGMRFL
jgi:hypothetical protein